MGDLFGSGGSSSTDRSNVLNAFGNLNKDQNSSTVGAGESGNAASYFQSILSGNPAAQAAAIAPVTNAASAQTEEQKKQISNEGTGRGGGTNAADQASEDAKTKASVDALTGLAPTAAGELAQIGGEQQQLGQQATSTLGDLALNSRQQNLAQRNAIGNDITTGVGDLIGLNPGGIFDALNAGPPGASTGAANFAPLSTSDPSSIGFLG